MSKFKMAFAAAALFGLSNIAAVAMPLDNLATVDTGVKAESVLWACNSWGRCWWRPNYDGAYSYYGPRYYNDYAYYEPRPYWGWRHRHWRHW